MVAQIDLAFPESARFQGPILRRSVAQLSTSFGGFFATCAAIYLCITVSLLMALPLSVLAAGFLVRIFILSMEIGTILSFSVGAEVAEEQPQPPPQVPFWGFQRRQPRHPR